MKRSTLLLLSLLLCMAPLRAVLAAEEAAARGNLPKAVAYLMERVDSQL